MMMTMLTWQEKLAVHRAMRFYGQALSKRAKKGLWTQTRLKALNSAWCKLFPEQANKRRRNE